MAELPVKFQERMKEQLGAEYEAFLECYQKEARPGLRINTGKISAEHFQNAAPFSLAPVPWTDHGFYYDPADSVTKHPYYYAGLYYIQEPSAMLPASRLPVEPGDLILDLCAAPGGKSTELASRLEGTGFLVSNDASASRAKALVKNLSIWGCSNCCITAEKPDRLLEAFGTCFDKILVDAPCSGEGMFRKDSGLIASWEKRGPAEYAAVQKEILTSAVPMLRPGGMLLYSTCTFSEEEDEEVVEWVLQQFPDLHLEDVEPASGLSHGRAPVQKTVRIWPHHAEGEGHFLALFRKEGACGSPDREDAQKAEAASMSLSGPAMQDLRSARGGKRRDRRTDSQSRTGGRTESGDSKEAEAFLQLLPESVRQGKVLRRIEDQCFLLPENVQLPRQLRYLRTGLLIGSCKNGRFEPAQPLAMVLNADSYPNVLDLPASDERITRYLKGETIDLNGKETVSRGWVLICVDGYALGWGKAAGSSIKNKYYQGWRLQ